MAKARKEWQQACGNTDLDTREIFDPRRKHDGHIFIVYMHRNKINGKVYVGLTYHANPNLRWGYAGQKYQHSRKFNNAIKKYGWNNFEHIVLCRTDKKRAIILERALIAYYKRKGISYNLADGGEGTECITEANRIALRKRFKENPPMKGKHHTPEARRLISEAGKRRVYTEEQKEQARKAAAKGRKTLRKNGYKRSTESIRKQVEKISRPVLQLNLEGIVLKEFPSTVAADEYLHNGKRYNHIADVCNGKRKTDGGYRWVYKENYYKEERRSA